MRLLVFILWLLMGVMYFLCSRYCCHDRDGIIDATVDRISSEKLPAAIKKNTPYVFLNNSEVLIKEGGWEKYTDSITQLLGDEEILEIKGYRYDNESDSLGYKRAQALAELFEEVDMGSMRFLETVLSDSFIRDNKNNLVSFRIAKNTQKIKEIDDRTLIYFSYGTTDKLADAEVEYYLDQVVDRVQRTNEKVRLVGYTDSDGSPEYNLELGERRSQTIADYLIRKGVIPNKLLIESRGENDPIATNDTEEGRAQNRRTELQIIK